MAKITDGTFKDWQDTEVMHASEYKQEREILRVAVNDNDERLSSLETSIAGVQLGTVQMKKITDDAGGVKLAIMDTSGDVLAELLKLGKGFHTFYAISGSKNLPSTNISIRGIAHFTSVDIGWVYATDYKNNIFTNYYDTGKWAGWGPLATSDLAQMSKLTNDVGAPKISVTDASDNLLSKIAEARVGFHTFYASSSVQGLPTTLSVRGFAHITSVSPINGYVQAYDSEGFQYTNYVLNAVWKGWKTASGINDKESATSLNNMKTRGSFYVEPGTANAPIGNWGTLNVNSFWDKTAVTHLFIDGTTGQHYTRAWTGFVWTAWK